MGVRVGILGAGQMGRIHGEVLARDPRVRIAGVADADSERAGRLAVALGARSFQDLEGLLREGVDLLVVATPNRFHADASRAALERGVAVLCEKPMATSLDDAREVCEAARRPGALYVVAHNRRHAPVYRRVRDLLDGGFKPLLVNMKMHEGDFRTPPWVSDRRVSGGFLYENLVHFFDLLEWLVAPMERLSCLARGPFYGELNDFIVSCEFEGGGIGALTATGHASWLHPAEKTELVGDHTAIVVEGLDRVLHSRHEGGAPAVHDESHLSREERWGYVHQDAEVLEAIVAGRRPCFSAARALRTLEIAEACASSARGGAAIRLGPPPRE